MQQIIAAIAMTTERLKSITPETVAAKPVTARDWAAFFQALAQFFTVLLPLILPLFTEDE